MGSRPSLEEDLDGARQTLDTLEEAGISLAAVTEELLEDGVRCFAEAFERTIATVKEARDGPSSVPTGRGKATPTRGGERCRSE